MAKIYKITSTAGDKVYIGSTIGTLEQRWREHKVPSNGAYSRKLFEEYGIETCSIHLLEEIKEDERIIKERWWIENTENVVNLRIEGRTAKEYYKANKESISQWQKEYNEANKESISQWKKQWYEANKKIILKNGSIPTPCPKCGKIIRQDGINRHLKRKHLSKVKLSNE